MKSKRPPCYVRGQKVNNLGQAVDVPMTNRLHQLLRSGMRTTDATARVIREFKTACEIYVTSDEDPKWVGEAHG